MALTGREKATILLSILGTDLSGEVLKHLPDELADLITSGINNLPTPSPLAISSILEEFSNFFTLQAKQKKVLQEPAPEPEQNDQIIRNDERKTQEIPMESNKSDLDKIFYSSPKKIAIALSAERPSVVAFILSLLPPVHINEVLSFMTDRKKEVEELLKSMKTNSINESLREKIVPIIADRLERLSER